MATPSSRRIVRGVLTGVFVLSILGLAAGLIGLVAGVAVDLLAGRGQPPGTGISLPRPLVLLVLLSAGAAVLSGLILAADDYRLPPP